MKNMIKTFLINTAKNKAVQEKIHKLFLKHKLHFGIREKKKKIFDH